MILDVEKMNQIVQGLHEVSIVREYGDDGAIALRSLLNIIPKLYTVINPETIKGSLLIFRNVIGYETRTLLGKPMTFTSISYLAAHCDAQRNLGTTIIQVGDTDQFHVWKEISITLTELSEFGIIYSWSKGEESFIVKNKNFPIPNPVGSRYASVFAIPTFRTLEEALEDYKWQSIRTSRCPIFSDAWEGGAKGKRLFFKKRPEELMRKSLQLYLQHVMRYGYVHPETRVDETHPVDIQIDWDLNNRVAIIEIKWIGDSLSDSGALVPHRDARANSGAKQLVDYLDAKHTWAAVDEVMGYLVVIDARRKGLTPESETIDETKGLWFKDTEIVFDPEYHKSRADFAEPIRMFAEPKCSPG